MIILALAFAVSLSASTSIKITAENPPVNMLNYSDLNIKLIPEFNFEEEAYIDDIPFDTECVSKNCIYQKAMLVAFDFEEEAFVDDIPFATSKVASESDFSFSEESFIDDIPFNTKEIANQNNRSQYVYNR